MHHLSRGLITLLLCLWAACGPAMAAPSISQPPASRTILQSGGQLTLAVTANGETNLNYQWKHNGLRIPGANSPTLQRPAITSQEGGLYSVEVSDIYGQTVRAWSRVYLTGPNRRIVSWGGSLNGILDAPSDLSDIIAWDIGAVHGLAIHSNGTVSGWGLNDSGQISIPADLTDVIAVSAGGNFSVALRADGTVRAWGNNSNGRATVPAGLSGVIEISAGKEHAMALKADGSLVSWGRNIYGIHTIPANAVNVATIAVGGDFSAVLRNDGTVVYWGAPMSATSGLPPPSDVVAISAGDSILLSLGRGGTVHCRSSGWGYGETLVPVGLSNVVAVAANYYHCAALKADGGVAAWGLNPYGQTSVPGNLGRATALGVGTVSTHAVADTTPPAVPAIVRAPVSVTAHRGSIVVLTARASGGFVSYQWFKGGQALPGKIRAELILPEIAEIEAGDYHVVATNPAGSATSAPATVTVVPAPVGTQSLVQLAPGQSVTLNATPLGVPPFTYQWRKDGRILVTQLAPQLTLASHAPADAGVYVAEATDSTGAKSRRFWFVRTAQTKTQVWTWGRNYNGQLNVPAGLDNAVQVAASNDASFALRADGVVLGWGNPYAGALPVPADLHNVVALATGSAHLLALRQDGTVRTWGTNYVSPVLAQIPEGLNEVTAVVAGSSFSLALRADRTLAAWGENSGGQINVPAGLNDVVALAAGNLHGLALRANGTVVAWGHNGQGQTTIPATLANVVAITAGADFSLALRADGTVVGWGNNAQGQITPPAGLANVAAISARGGTAHALRRDGTIVSWGDNDNGQATAPAGLENLIGLAAGDNHTLALRDASADTVPVFLTQPVSQTANPGATVTFTASASGGLVTYQWFFAGLPIAGGTGPTLVLSDVGPWDSGAYHVVTTNYLGTTTSETVTLATTPNATLSQTRLALRPGAPLQLEVAPSGPGPFTYRWRKNGLVIPGATGPVYTRAAVTAADAGVYIADVTDSAGGTASQAAFVFVSQAPTQLWEFGPNFQGRRTGLANMNDLVAVACGGNTSSTVLTHSIALRFDGTVLPFGDLPAQAQPALPAGLSGVVAIASSADHFLALRADGRVIAWGNNASGKATVPARLGGIVAVSAGGGHSLALRVDGTVAAWGSNTYGETTVPAGLGTVVAIAAGGGHSLALRADGTVAAWGQNNQGQCNVPAFLSGVVAIAAGAGSSFALKTDGTVVAWGLNTDGQTNVPAGLTGVAGIVAGHYQVLARKSDGTVVSWGRSDYNQRAIPADMQDVVGLAGGFLRSLVLRDASADTVPAFLTSPADHTVRVGTNVVLSAQATGVFRSYQWFKGDQPIPGQTGTSLSLINIQTTAAGDYTLVATNHLGSATSEAGTITVIPPPQIISAPPAALSLLPGGSAALTVGAIGEGPLTYRWKRDGRPIPGATGPAHTLSNVGYAADGVYIAEVTDVAGVTSRTISFVQVTRPSTHLMTWGDNSLGQRNIPGPFHDVQRIAAWGGHTLALRAGGGVVAWGGNDYGQSTVPGALSSVVRLAAGAAHSLALRAEGSVVGWGRNDEGQAIPPASLGPVVAIAAGETHSLAVRSDGTVVHWGNATYGNPPAGLSEVVAVAAGLFHSLALRADGTVVGWGNSVYGQLNVPVGLTGVVSIAATTTGSIALKADGTVATWGTFYATPPAGLANLRIFATGWAHGLAIRNDETLVTWGQASFLTGTPVVLENVFAAVTGFSHSVVLRDSSADSVPAFSLPPVALTVPHGRSVTLGGVATGPMLTYQWFRGGTALPLATRPTLTIPAAGAADDALYSVQVTNYLGAVTSTPVRLTVLAPPTVTLAPPASLALPATDTLTLQVAATGASPLSYRWRRDGQLLAGASQATYQGPARSGVYVVEITDALNSVTRRATHVFATAPNHVVAWGSNSSGQITVPAGSLDALAVAAGIQHSLALRADGTVFGWGTNFDGQISVPAGLGGVVAIAAGGNHSLALKADGTVAAWGYNGAGQASPPAGLASVVALTANGSHSLALKLDGTVVAWGANNHGQAAVPSSLCDVVAITATISSSIALRADGTLVVWGENPAGQLNPPAGLPPLVGIGAAANHLVGLAADGAVFAWGGNEQGESLVPAGLPPAEALAAGGDASFALLPDRSVRGWGYPVQAVPPTDLGRVQSIRAGTAHVLALRERQSDTAPVITAFDTTPRLLPSWATLTVAVEASGVLRSYQWYQGTSPLSGQTGATLAILVNATSSGDYSVKVTNYLGTATSEKVSVTVVAPPAVSVSPPTRTILTSASPSLSLAVTASGQGPLAYVWKKDGRILPGITGPSLLRSPAGRADAGIYMVEITDTLGQMTRVISHVLYQLPSPQAGGWSSLSPDQITPPANAGTLVAIAAGGDCSLGLRADGSVVAWGSNLYGQTTVYSTLINASWGAHAVAISAGSRHCLALQSNGTILAWGSSSGGRTTVPGGIFPVVAISAGYEHSLALKADSTVVAWGGNTGGQSTVPVGLAGVVAISAGYNHSLALKADGTVVAWGDNSLGQCTVPAGLGPVVGIAAGQYFSMALRADGTVTVWSSFASYRNVPAGLADVVAIAAGDSSAVARKADGTVVVWGTGGTSLTQPPAGAIQVFAIDAGASHVLVLRDATLDTAPAITLTPVAPTVLTGASITFTATVGAEAGLCTYQWQLNGSPLTGKILPTLALSNVQPTQAGTYSVVVTNARGPTTSGGTLLTVIPPPTLVTVPPARQLLQIGQPLVLGVSATGATPLSYRWKRNGRVIPGLSSSILSRDSATGADVGTYVIEVGDANGLVSRAIAHVLLPVTGSRLAGWGDNSAGQLTPPALAGADLVALAAGSAHALAVRADGSVLAWGQNTYNQTTAPTGLANVVGVAAGDRHSLALRADGTVAAWGQNTYGQTSIASATSVVAVRAGLEHSLAIRADGTVVHAGRYSEYSVSGLANVVDVAGGATHSLALLASGAVVVWGPNPGGLPMTPAGLLDVVAIAAGDNYSVALLADGTVVAWGQNTYGQTDVPAGLRDVVAISARGNHTLALLTDGTVVAWGRNTNAQATPPATLQDVRMLAAGGAFSVALRDSSLDGQPFVQAPASPVYVPLGGSARIGVAAFGGSLAFAWTKNGADIPQTTGPTRVLTSATNSDAGIYTVTATNASGSASASFTVQVIPPPALSIGASARTVLTPGQPLRIEAAADGDGVLSYRWFKDGRALAATTPVFELSAASVPASGRYEIEVTDSHGGGVSRAAAWVYVVPEQQQVVVWGAHPSVVPTALGRVIAVEGGAGYTLALRADGTVALWGPGASPFNPIPPEVHDVVAISAGDDHALALRSDGTVVAWGANAYGQSTPPAGLGGVVAISAGGLHSLALRGDGTVVAWGDSGHGQTTVPAGLKNVAAISAGYLHSLALRADGTASVWGREFTISSLSLLQGTAVGLWSDLSAISAGRYLSIGLRADGSVLARHDLLTSPFLPRGVAGTAVALSLGDYHALSSGPEGTLHLWNPSGETSHSKPLGISAAALFTTGSFHSVAVRDSVSDRLPAFATSPGSMTTPLGQPVTFTAGATDAIYYRWYRNGSEISGTAAASLTLAARAAEEEGTYEVRAVSGAGEVVSAPFTLRFAESFNTWRVRGFSSADLSDNTISGPLASPGSDQAPNLLKYALGVAPREPLGAAAGSVVPDSGGLTFIYERPADRPDVTYEVQTSTDLVHWSSIGVDHTRMGNAVDGIEVWLGRVNDDAAPSRFFRLNVNRPTTP